MSSPDRRPLGDRGVELFVCESGRIAVKDADRKRAQRASSAEAGIATGRGQR